jgi:hypothetical protein
MTKEQKIIRAKVGLLELARQLPSAPGLGFRLSYDTNCQIKS